MIKTFTRTMFIEDLRNAKVTVYVTDDVKYNLTETSNETKVEYNGITSWDIISGGVEAEKIEAEVDAASIDEYHEYLVLHFEDGTQATFRNSHADMFIR